MQESIYPEWEIEEAIVRNPSIILNNDDFKDFSFYERQRILPSGIRLDLLFKDQRGTYLIIELKGVYITDKDNVLDQILSYKHELSKWKGIPESQILCMVASPKGAENSVIHGLRNQDVTFVWIDEKKISTFLPKMNDIIKYSIELDGKSSLSLRILQRRLNLDYGLIIENLLLKDTDRYYREIKSVKEWIINHCHDEESYQQIGVLFKNISNKAPIMAHEVNSKSDGLLKSDYDKWFWLFYSVMDRRANASLFVNAKKALENKDFFLPNEIVDYYNNTDENSTLFHILEILKENNYTPMSDSNLKELAIPKSILDSALLISKYDYSFNSLYQFIINNSKNNDISPLDIAWEIFSQNIYGVGDRICGQIIRGLVLKSNWDIKLDNNKMLEKNKYNLEFAGKRRFGLIDDENNYNESLGKFAELYLNGNRGIIGHILWYIRKKHCWKVPRCDNCPLSGYCFYYLKKETDKQRKICDKNISCEECKIREFCGYFSNYL